MPLEISTDKGWTLLSSVRFDDQPVDGRAMADIISICQRVKAYNDDIAGSSEYAVLRDWYLATLPDARPEADITSVMIAAAMSGSEWAGMVVRMMPYAPVMVDRVGTICGHVVAVAFNRYDLHTYSSHDSCGLGVRNTHPFLASLLASLDDVYPMDNSVYETFIDGYRGRVWGGLTLPERLRMTTMERSRGYLTIADITHSYEYVEALLIAEEYREFLQEKLDYLPDSDFDVFESIRREP